MALRDGRAFEGDNSPESDLAKALDAAEAGGFFGSLPNPDGTGNILLHLDPARVDPAQLTGDPNIQQIDGEYYIPSNLLQSIPSYSDYGKVSTWADILKYPTSLAAMAAGGYALGGAGAAGGSAFPAGSIAGADIVGGGLAAGEVAGGATLAGGTGDTALIGGAGGDTLATTGVESLAAEGSYATTADSLAAANAANTAAYTPTLAELAGTSAAGSQVINETGGGGGGGGGGTGPIISDAGLDLSTLGSLVSAVPGNVWAGLLQGGLGYLGADQQADALSDVYAQQSAIGAPYRDTLAASYQPGFDLWSQPGYAGAFQQSADAAARAVSAKSGNPFGSPGAMGEIQGALMNQSYLPALSNYRGQLGQFGNLGLNTSGQASLMGAQQAGSGLNAIGYGLNTALNPQPTLADLLNQNRNMPLSYGRP